MAVPDEHAHAAKAPGEGPHPEGGRNGLARHVDGLGAHEEPRLRLQVARVHLDAEGAGAAGHLLRRDACQLEGVRDHGQARPRARARSTTRTRRSSTSSRSTSGRRRSPTAATARRTAWTTRSGSRPGPSSRAEPQSAAGGAPPSRRRALAPPLAEGGSRCSRRRSSRSCVVYIAALVALFVSAFWTVDPFTGDSSTAGRSTTSGALARARSTARRAAHGPDRRRRDGDRRDHRVPVRVLHGAGAGPRVRAAAVRPRAAAALGVLPRACLRVAADPQPRRPAELDLHKLGLPSANIGYTNTAMWIVFSYIWLPFMILPVYAALERIPHSYSRPRATSARRAGRTLRTRDPAAGAARHRRRVDLHVLADARRLHHADPGRRRRRRSSSATSSTTRSTASGNLPFAAAFAVVPLS